MVRIRRLAPIWLLPLGYVAVAIVARNRTFRTSEMGGKRLGKLSRVIVSGYDCADDPKIGGASQRLRSSGIG